MQVRHEVKNLVLFSNFDYGDVFRNSSGDIFMKVKSWSQQGLGVNAIDLENGNLYNFEQNAEFEPLMDAVLVY